MAFFVPADNAKSNHSGFPKPTSPQKSKSSLFKFFKFSLDVFPFAENFAQRAETPESGPCGDFGNNRSFHLSHSEFEVGIAHD